MTKTRVILDPAGPGNSTFSDPGETLKRTEFAARVAAVARKLTRSTRTISASTGTVSA